LPPKEEDEIEELEAKEKTIDMYEDGIVKLDAEATDGGSEGEALDL